MSPASVVKLLIWAVTSAAFGVWHHAVAAGLWFAGASLMVSWLVYRR